MGLRSPCLPLKSLKLSALVEEIDLVGWIERGEWLDSYFPWRVLAILLYIRNFQNLKSFYLGIALHNFTFSIAYKWGGPEAQAEFRSRLLFTLFACIAGEWTEEEHASLLDYITRQKKPEDDKGRKKKVRREERRRQDLCPMEVSRRGTPEDLHRGL